MDKERVGANAEARPVKDWENKEVKGDALAHKRIFEQHKNEVAELRQRQEQYEKDLPKEPKEALRDIHRTLMDTRDIAEPYYAPRAALELISLIASSSTLSDGDDARHALYWLANQGLNGLDLIDAATARSRHIAYQFEERHEPFKA
ncbi:MULTISPECIES: hypothetical protein [unclassified Roseovarius]|uniref:hypothetical protein n=1 Tax=unclassified Roseovarius TaxID=2614913 RepID=UPI00273E3269|nr:MULTISPECIES: hypothetical protein [unclassified Roseovarius]